MDPPQKRGTPRSESGSFGKNPGGVTTTAPPMDQTRREHAIADGGFHHDYLATIQTEPVMGEIILSTTGEPFVFNQATAIQPCWLCNSSDKPETLFTPCACEGMVHRHCFRKWRQGWINPRNYWNCPRCQCNYNIERIKEATTKSKDEIKQGYRKQLLKLWVGVLFFFGSIVFALAGFMYLCDTGHKRVPVATKYLLSSAANGFPDGNTTKVWEENFKDPNVPVWPYYTLLAVFLSSVGVLISFAVMGTSFSKSDYSGRTCCGDCNYCCSNNNDVCCIYCISCDDADCNCCRGTHRHRTHTYYGGGGGNAPPCDCSGCNCSGCHCSGGDCKGDKDCAQVLIVLLVIIIIVVIISAVFVVIGYTIQRSALLYDRYSAMMYNQQEELEGETIVLGLNETWRPLNQV